MRLKKKVANLIADLCVNDDGIFEENPFTVRTHFCNDLNFVNQVISIVQNTDLSSIQEI